MLFFAGALFYSFAGSHPSPSGDIKIFLPEPGAENKAADSVSADTAEPGDDAEKKQAAPPSRINMAWIESGCFVMGSPDGEGDPDEHPQHRVCLSGFYMDRYEVTQEEYQRLTKKNPSVFSKCPNCPVEYVSWTEAKEYCERTGKRLPTEAEWEYAARGGTQTRYFWGNSMDTAYVWYQANAGNKTHPVGQKRPNPFGLYDMLGNVREWCSDRFSDNTYRTSTVNDPVSVTGRYPVMRGGSWMDDAKKVRCMARASENPKTKDSMIGFRCAADK
ncbi:MAG TPA: formylglycine-generating enzyme family protein [Chitinivibrionales bacterium]|nr:formylglycine-generating enzyme family protein [Chitinivibrionales bacterium]